jgi:stage II sporulation protein M
LAEIDPGPNEASGTTTPVAVRRRGFLGRLYREEWNAWRRHYRKYFKHAARALGLGFIAGFLYFMLWPAQEKKALELVVKALKDIRLEDPPLVLALTLFYHNARASVLAVAAGALPFLFLPILDPVMNGAVLGLLSSISRHQGLNVPHLILTQILPHGVFELTAVLYATSVGLYLSAGMGKRALAAWRKRKIRRRGEPPPPVGQTDFLETYSERSEAEYESLAGNVFRSFFLVVLPLLLVAAFIESFVTPNLR